MIVLEEEMKKDDSGSADQVKHSRNSLYGKKGHNRRLRRKVKHSLKKGDTK